MRKLNFPQLLQPAFWTVSFLVLATLFSACQPAQVPSTVIPEEPTATMTAILPVVPESQPASEMPVSEVDFSAQLVGPLWMLLGYGDAGNPTVVEPGVTVTLQFSNDGSLGGFGGCNNYFGSYELDGDVVQIAPLGSTMMACETGMEQEGVVLAALNSAYRINFTTQGRLEIFYDSDASFERKMVFTQSQKSLLDTIWLLEEYGNINEPAAVEAGTFITAQFTKEGLMSGYSGCNRYSTSFVAENGRLEIGMPASSLRECLSGMEQEAVFQQALIKAESYAIKGDVLEITYDAGQGVLRFTSNHLPIENVLWTLVTVNGETIQTGTSPTTLLFEPGNEPYQGMMGGAAMCNNYSGGFTIDQDALSLQVLTTTRLRCPEDVMQAESNYLEILESTQSYMVLGQTLTITSEKGVLVFAANRASLEGTYWRLVSMGTLESPTIPGDEANFTALFVPQEGGPSGLVLGSTGCNDYNAPYVANLKELKVNLPFKTNNSECPQDFWEQEQQFFLGMNSASTYRILGDSLQIPYDEGRQSLNFVATVPVVEPGEGALTSLNGTRWWLVTIGPKTVLPGTQTTAEFAINPDGETGQISGSSGCNTYNTEITGVLRVGPVATTKLFCAEPAGLMDQEFQYLDALASANSFAKVNNQLLISTQKGLLVFYNSPAPLQPIVPPTQLPPLPPGPTEIAPTPEATEAPVPEPTEEPSPAPPVAIITAPEKASVNQSILFDAGSSTSSGSITSYAWDFGDGAQADGVTIEHTYANPGTYTVMLTITDINGKTATTTHIITIQ
ncbi:MAG TPA: META domain-containing protein [Anaerolineales bacterium]|nr:META domain-containing protein [Anaerolineales bacterium]